MLFERSVILCLLSIALSVKCASLDTGDVEQQGLYSTSDQVVIVTEQNFARKVYGQNHALVLQFYNSYCGHCRAFAPKFKELAADVAAWKDVVRLAVLDCSVEENNALCREFDVMAYPTLRYIHENFIKANEQTGEPLSAIDSAEHLKNEILQRLQREKSLGRLAMLPDLNIASYGTSRDVLDTVPTNVLYTFVVFESPNSTIGTELILDTNDYVNVRVLRGHDNSALAANQRHFPALLAVRNNLDTMSLTPNNPSRKKLLFAINTYLSSKHYEFPVRRIEHEDKIYEHHNRSVVDADVVYYADLEKTLRTALFVELPRHQHLTGEPLQAALNFLDVIIQSFPFMHGNGRNFVIELKNSLLSKQSWSGEEIENLVRDTERRYAPVFTQNVDFIGCRGSQAQYRGYSCGLWTLFHTLTVNAAKLPGQEGPKVLQAMHGYIKNFFGCTECAEHFQDMAARNKIFDVKENNKAVLWLWISHNEVNLRLAGDSTEDPAHPKIQFPKVSRCPQCRLARGAWNLPAVYRYLTKMYGDPPIVNTNYAARSNSAPSPFSPMDMGLLSLLYIICILFIIFLIKYLLSKRFYRKRIYKHDAWGKV